jgi:CBS domain containing-hemolysin-like protein
LWLFVLALAGAEPCSAAGSEFVDSAANVLAVFIIIAVPIGGIVLFWLVHILPEKFAEKRHHPQLAAIKTLCLLSLVFGGVLWPLAWLWAFTKPVMHQLAYGRDRHDDYYEKHGLPMPAGDEAQALRTELARVRQEIAELEKRGDLPTALQALRERRSELEGAVPQATTSAGAG